MRRSSLALLLTFAALNLAGCEREVNPDPRPTGLGVKRFRPLPEGDAGEGGSGAAAEEDAGLRKSPHPVA